MQYSASTATRVRNAMPVTSPAWAKAYGSPRTPAPTTAMNIVPAALRLLALLSSRT